MLDFNPYNIISTEVFLILLQIQLHHVSFKFEIGLFY